MTTGTKNRAIDVLDDTFSQVTMDGDLSPLIAARIGGVDLPVDTRIWVLTRLLPARAAFDWAYDQAKSALDAHWPELNSRAPYRCLHVARSHADGAASDEEVDKEARLAWGAFCYAAPGHPGTYAAEAAWFLASRSPNAAAWACSRLSSQADAVAASSWPPDRAWKEARGAAWAAQLDSLVRLLGSL